MSEISDTPTCAYVCMRARSNVSVGVFILCWKLKASLKLEHNLKAVMLYGPAGAGKTMMVEAIASEVGTGFCSVGGVCVTKEWGAAGG